MPATDAHDRCTGAGINLIQPILHYARTQPDAVALIEGERTLTYRALAELVARTAGHLSALGVVPGERVAVCLKDSADHLVALLAVGYLGAVFIPIDWRAGPAEKAHLAEALALRLALIETDRVFAGSCPTIGVDAAWHEAARRAAPRQISATGWHAPWASSSVALRPHVGCASTRRLHRGRHH